MLNEALHYAQANRDTFLKDLLHYLAIPSVSAQPEHKADVQRAAEWLAQHLNDIGVRSSNVGGLSDVICEVVEMRKAVVRFGFLFALLRIASSDLQLPWTGAHGLQLQSSEVVKEIGVRRLGTRFTQ